MLEKDNKVKGYYKSKEKLKKLCNLFILYFRNTTTLVKHIYANEGLTKGFYKGISMNFIKGPIAIGTSLSMKNLINRNMDKNYDK